MSAMTKKKSYILAELTKDLAVTLQGDPNCQVDGVCSIQDSKPGCITFLAAQQYRSHLAQTQAAAVILTANDVPLCPVPAIITSNPSYIYAKIAAYFAREVVSKPGIHPTAVVGMECDIHPTASIGAHCYLGDRVRIGEYVRIGAHCTLEDDCHIGAHSVLDAKVTLYAGCQLGQRCHLASGVIIGCDGFGFAQHQGEWHKIPQLGVVCIGNDVDIGANTAIDRGAIGDTIIENGVKLDNLIQIGHNVRIGANTIISGCVAIAGSTIIGKNCMIGGASCFAGHLTVCDHVVITGMSSVTKSIREPGIYSSGIVGMVTNQEFRKNNARFHRLEQLAQRVKKLELNLKVFNERDE